MDVKGLARGPSGSNVANYITPIKALTDRREARHLRRGVGMATGTQSLPCETEPNVGHLGPRWPEQKDC